MKAHYINLATTLLLITSSIAINAQSLIGTRMDVAGTRYGDQVWVFTVASTTRGFDNGWDAYKLSGASIDLPQIYASEAAGNFQIDVVPDLNNTYISFRSGEDSIYTLTLTSQLLCSKYSCLYLYDSVANIKTDIMCAGVKYSFKAKQYSLTTRRFKITTKAGLENIGTYTDNQEINTAQLEICSRDKTIRFINPTSAKGKAVIYDISGRQLSETDIEPYSNTSSSKEYQTGNYLVRVWAGDIQKKQLVSVR